MINIAVNGFGRIGRLATRVLAKRADMQITHINDPNGDIETFAHLLKFDSVHGIYDLPVELINGRLQINGKEVTFTNNKTINDIDFGNCNLVIESSGKFLNTAKVREHFLNNNVRQVVVSAPIKEPGVLNIVMGVNQDSFDKTIHDIVTAASCTTNCVAPAIKIIHENFRISHGCITTVHNITNTQCVLDQPHKDLRRARSCGMSLIPTTTGSAKAITDIFPELTNRLNGHAIRVPLTNSSITDCVFELSQKVNAEQVNEVLESASNDYLKGILGYETRPLVSIDFRTDPRSCIVDALSTMVVNGTQLKLYLWYDNEWGYANRLIELAAFTGRVRGL